MSARAVLLPVFAAVLVASVLGVQIAAGGGDFVPKRSADPCAERAVTPVSTGIEGLAEQLVLLGLDGAACRLGESRESLLLDLADDDERTDVQIEALRAGLLDAVDRLDREGRLPKASALADEALDEADLNRFVKAAIRAIPDRIIDNRLKTDNVLRRAIEDLDIRRVLDNLDDPSELNSVVRRAVTEAVKDEIVDGLPDPF